MKLNDPSLLRQQCYIDGAWCDADSGETVPVTNPANGEVLGTVPKMGAAETRRAIEAAERAWPAWRSKTAKERAVVLRRWHDLMMENQEDLAVLMTAEQGKPLAESRGEIVYGSSFIDWFAEEGRAFTAIRSRRTRPTSAFWRSSSRSGCARQSRRGTSRTR